MCAPAGGRAGRGGRGPSERGREEAGRVWGERTSQARGLSDGVHGRGASGAGQCQAAQQGRGGWADGGGHGPRSLGLISKQEGTAELF